MLDRQLKAAVVRMIPIIRPAASGRDRDALDLVEKTNTRKAYGHKKMSYAQRQRPAQGL